MSIEVARYQFHSWARRGIAANITDTDDLGSGTVHTKERAQVELQLDANGQPVAKRFSLVGPGDVIGINREMIVRTEPLNWITDFEPNYLPFVEFYDEDFAWRHTPASAAGERLRPWVALLVLAEDEFERTPRKVPLPSINIKDKTAVQPAGELWLWAHVHSNADIADADLSVYERFLNSLNAAVETDPDGVYCRVLSPRHLQPDTAYTAFLVPTFEVGRLAGLGQATTDVDAQQPSWQADGTAGEMPVYYEWFFRTGRNEDFESLVELLQPRPMDPRVGIRAMDCSAPGFTNANASAPLPGTSPALIGLEGALKSPTTVSTVFPDPPTSIDFQTELQGVVNLGERTAANLTDDPIVTMPLYGKNHARRRPDNQILLDITQQTWLHDLNKDPRTRGLAGVGTCVIQDHQEAYMRAAWLQIEQINEANRRLREASATVAIATPLYLHTVATLAPPQLLAYSRPVLAKVMGSPTTLQHQVMLSRLPAAALSGAFRRTLRPLGPFARHLAIDRAAYSKIIEGLNEGTLTAAPERVTPAGLPTTQGAGDALEQQPGLGGWLARNLALLLLLLVLLLVAAVLGGNALLAAAALPVAAAAATAWVQLQRREAVAKVLRTPEQARDVITSVPARPSFNVQVAGETSVPAATAGGANGDSVEAQNFRVAVAGLSALAQLRPPTAPPPLAFSISTAHQKLAVALRPRHAHGVRLSKLVKIRNLQWAEETEPIREVMAYPDFEEPMYKKLLAQSNEFLLPNLKLIPPNTVSLLQTNQKAIEAYMVGLNHEMARELLWREFPTDLMGSPFCQFWDVTGVVRPDTSKSAEQLAKELKDIQPIHTWPLDSLLGRHNNRDAQGDATQVVLVVRGDVLKRYPNSLVFAQKAVLDSHGTRIIDLDLTTAEFSQQLLFPLYKAEIPPDIKLFGFDLTPRQARGDDPSPGFPATDKEGWFFVIQEVPGEPRFGMDIRYDPGSDGVTWADLSWQNFPSPDPPFVTASPHPTGIAPTDNSPGRWGTHAANMAYILFQKPSMVAVHSSEMLAKLDLP